MYAIRSYYGVEVAQRGDFRPCFPGGLQEGHAVFDLDLRAVDL